MIDDQLNVPFLAARAALRQLGIDLTMQDGRFCVNVRGGDARTAYFTNNLHDAIKRGREMAARGCKDEARLEQAADGADDGR